MGTVQSGMFLTKEDQEKFDSWSKEDIYEAYLSEKQVSITLNREVNRLNRKLAEIRFAAKVDLTINE